MKVYCMRHAQAVSAVEDASRQLSPEGETEVKLMGEFLKKRGLQIDHILHSEKTRTEQTAKGLAPFVQCDHVMSCGTGINEEDDAADMLPVVAAWESDTLIVSHLPFISRLVGAMVTGDANQNILTFAPCTIACLDKVGEDKWILDWIVNPRLIHQITR